MVSNLIKDEDLQRFVSESTELSDQESIVEVCQTLEEGNGSLRRISEVKDVRNTENKKGAHKVFGEMSTTENFKQKGTVQEYYDLFDSLFKDLGLNESYVIDIFIWGLQPEIEKWVKILKPKTLSDAYCLAKMQEATNNLIKENFIPSLLSSQKFEDTSGIGNNNKLVVHDDLEENGDKCVEMESFNHSFTALRRLNKEDILKKKVDVNDFDNILVDECNYNKISGISHEIVAAEEAEIDEYMEKLEIEKVEEHYNETGSELVSTAMTRGRDHRNIMVKRCFEMSKHQMLWDTAWMQDICPSLKVDNDSYKVKKTEVNFQGRLALKGGESAMESVVSDNTNLDIPISVSAVAVKEVMAANDQLSRNHHEVKVKDVEDYNRVIKMGWVKEYEWKPGIRFWSEKQWSRMEYGLTEFDSYIFDSVVVFLIEKWRRIKDVQNVNGDELEIMEREKTDGKLEFVQDTEDVWHNFIGYGHVSSNKSFIMDKRIWQPCDGLTVVDETFIRKPGWSRRRWKKMQQGVDKDMNRKEVSVLVADIDAIYTDFQALLQLDVSIAIKFGGKV